MAPSPPRRLLAALAVLALVAGCGGEGRAPEAASLPPPSVTVTPVVKTRLPDERERVGQVRAVEDVELRARVSGFLEERDFEEGSDVAKDQLLFVIERAPYEAKVEGAEADLARARAAAKEAELGLRRTRELHESTVASQAALDAALAKDAQARAEVLAAQAALREARIDLDYTEIRAPVAGRVGRSLFSVGDLVDPESGTLTTIAKLDPIYVYWQVPEQVLLDVRRDQVARTRRGEGPLQVTAHLRFSDGSLYEHEGTWDFLDNRVDPTTGTQTARAVFPNPDRVLLPGQYARVTVSVGQPYEALVIPQSAVQEDQAGRFVLVVGADDTVALQRVVMGARQGIYWEVRSGLAEGERVVYEGVQKARPGGKVAPVELRPEPPVGGAPGEA